MKYLASIALLLLLLLLLAFPVSASALDVTVSINTLTQATVGNAFIVRVNIANVTNLDAVAFRVRFNPAILDLSTKDADSNGTYDSIVGGVVGGKKVAILATVQKEPGLIGIVAQVQPSLSGATGSGYLVELHFNALSLGTSNIGLEHYSLSDATAETITATWKDGSVTTSAPGGGGGGGGGTPTIDTNLFGTAGSFNTNSSGVIQTEIKASSADGKLTIDIPKGTKALDKNGNPLASMTAGVFTNPPAPPANANIIGLAYDFGPAGATFQPAITFTWSYDPAALPEGVTEKSLVIAYYDTATGKWVELTGVIDTVNHTVTATVTHFTTYAMLGTVAPTPTPPPTTTPTTTPPKTTPPAKTPLVTTPPAKTPLVTTPPVTTPPTTTPPTKTPVAEPNQAFWWYIIGAAVVIVIGVIIISVRRRHG